MSTRSSPSSRRDAEPRPVNPAAWAGQAGHPKRTSTLLMLASTAILLPLLFPPFYCWFLAPIALVPFCVCILRRPMRLGYLGAYYLLGVAFFLPNLFWLAPVTVGGWIALALFVGLYFPLFAIALHRLVVQLRLPGTLAVPLAWTAVEYMRATFLHGGFPWFLLGNCLAPAPLLIQTADLFGVWGLTFFLALLNGLIVDLLRLPIYHQGRLNPVILRLATVAGAMLAFVIGYGIFRLNQQTTTPGPRVAVIQQNFPQHLKEDPNNTTRLLVTHLQLAREAAESQPKPDLIGWPETMEPCALNASFIDAPAAAFRDFGDDAKGMAIAQDNARYARELIQQLSDKHQVAQLLGYGSFEPRGNWDNSIKQNRTALMLPGRGIVEEYAKVHLVPFGEYLPFRELPVVGKWMVKLSPYGFDYSNTPGTRWTRFALTVPVTSQPAPTAPATSAARRYTFGTPICFEDVMPEPARLMTAPQFGEGEEAGKKTDFLLNVSNDGWFHWIELDQHLQASQLRAVENRVPIARSVNTGNSGFIDSNGRILGLVQGANGSIGAVGTMAMVLSIDSRVTLFSKVGDLLPLVCGILTTVLVGWTFARPRLGFRPPPPGAPGAEPPAGGDAAGASRERGI